MSNIEVCAGIGALVRASAAATSVDPAELSARVGLDRTLTTEPDARVSIESEQSSS